MFELIISRPPSYWPPPSGDPQAILVQEAKNRLVAALHNYHTVTAGLSESLVPFWEVPPDQRMFLNQRVQVVERAVWGQ